MHIAVAKPAQLPTAQARPGPSTARSAGLAPGGAPQHGDHLAVTGPIDRRFRLT
jgi:hypothetical protein